MAIQQAKTLSEMALVTWLNIRMIYFHLIADESCEFMLIRRHTDRESDKCVCTSDTSTSTSTFKKLVKPQGRHLLQMNDLDHGPF